MSLTDLGKKVFQAAHSRGKALWSELGKDFNSSNIQWEKIREEFLSQGTQFVQDLERELRGWILEEGRKQGVSWSYVLGRDPRVEESYRLLELPYGTEMDGVKHRFRELLKEHHPDRYMADPKKYQLATRKSQVLTEAYHQIQKAIDEGRV
ncbi:MAG: J domain-containing protein [Myxococcales bacterium]|nr:J domain-containing protein [Myxococcales bacterium]MCB9642925.1 J domain-containing protein [Myxococcales bacterium]